LHNLTCNLGAIVQPFMLLRSYCTALHVTYKLLHNFTCNLPVIAVLHVTYELLHNRTCYLGAIAQPFVL